jgi:hypothetical protein
MLTKAQITLMAKIYALDRQIEALENERDALAERLAGVEQECCY